MNNYRVSFYKDLCTSDGHSFKGLQRQIEVQSVDPPHALVLAERLVDNERLNADRVEVTHLADHPEFEPPACYKPAPGKHAWNRIA